MRLVDVDLTLNDDPVPAHVAAAGRRQAANRYAWRKNRGRPFRHSSPAISNWSTAHWWRSKSGHLATGRRFLEWGSGHRRRHVPGGVGRIRRRRHRDRTTTRAPRRGTCEKPRGRRPIRMRQLRAARRTSCGSNYAGDVLWLSTERAGRLRDLELEPDDFDVIFAYPWPGEEQVIFDLFADCAAVGALLLTYHGQEGLRLHAESEEVGFRMPGCWEQGKKTSNAFVVSPCIPHPESCILSSWVTAHSANASTISSGTGSSCGSSRGRRPAGSGRDPSPRVCRRRTGRALHASEGLPLPDGEQPVRHDGACPLHVPRQPGSRAATGGAEARSDSRIAATRCDTRGTARSRFDDAAPVRRPSGGDGQSKPRSHNCRSK